MSDLPNSGLLFKNFRKKQPNHPDYYGTCEINGVKLEIAAWIKPLKSGRGKFMSLSFSAPRQRASTNGMPSAEAPVPTEQDMPASEAQPQPKAPEGDGFLI